MVFCLLPNFIYLENSGIVDAGILGSAIDSTDQYPSLLFALRHILNPARTIIVLLIWLAK